MAGKPVAVQVTAETNDFSKAIDKGVIKPFDKAADAMKDVQKQSDKTSDALVDDMKDAQKATEKFQAAMADGAAPRKFKEHTEEATHKTKESMNEVTQEAKANASETFSSFDGSATSFADGIQGTFGGLVSSLGPVGLAIGAAGAIGIGLLTANMEKAKARAQEVKDKIGELSGEMIDAGGKGEIAFGDVADALHDLATETDDAKTSLKDISVEARKAGVPFEDLAQAFAGNKQAVEDSITLTKKRIDSDQAYLDAGEDFTKRFEHTIARRRDANKDVLKSLEDVSTELQTAATNEQLWLDAGGDKYATKASLVEQINSAYDDAAGSVDAFIDAESGLFDVSAYITAMDARSKALADYQDNLIKADLPPDAIKFLNSQGADVASAMVAGYIAASPANRTKLQKIWTDAAADASGTIGDKLTTVINATYAGPVIKPTLDSRAFENGLRRITSSIDVDVAFKTRDGRIVK